MFRGPKPPPTSPGSTWNRSAGSLNTAAKITPHLVHALVRRPHDIDARCPGPSAPRRLSVQASPAPVEVIRFRSPRPARRPPSPPSLLRGSPASWRRATLSGRARMHQRRVRLQANPQRRQWLVIDHHRLGRVQCLRLGFSDDARNGFARVPHVSKARTGRTGIASPFPMRSMTGKLPRVRAILPGQHTDHARHGCARLRMNRAQ